MDLQQEMSPTEAAERWGQKRNTIIAGLNRGLEKKEGKWYSVIEKELVRFYETKNGTKEWYITIQAMKELYGEPKGDEQNE